MERTISEKQKVYPHSFGCSCPQSLAKSGFRFSNKNVQKWQKWLGYIQENIKWVGVAFLRKFFFLTKKVNKQLKSLWVRKESPQTGHLRKKVVFYKSCVFSYIGKTKNFSGHFGDIHCCDFFKIQSRYLPSVLKKIANMNVAETSQKFFLLRIYEKTQLL